MREAVAGFGCMHDHVAVFQELHCFGNSRIGICDNMYVISEGMEISA